jgi:hypothetical protein
MGRLQRQWIKDEAVAHGVVEAIDIGPSLVAAGKTQASIRSCSRSQASLKLWTMEGLVDAG